MDENVSRDYSKDEDVPRSGDWTERYRPEGLEDVAGNAKAKKELRAWAREWDTGEIPKNKAVILAGKPGVGKTTSAIALARDMGWEALEMNASDDRNKDAIRQFIGRSAVDDTFSAGGDFIPYKKGKRTLLILDEADNVFGNEDRGGIVEIKNTVQKTQQPMILIVNDYYGLRNRSKDLSQMLKKIDFEAVSVSDIVGLLKNICEVEGISADYFVLKSIAERAEGDVRSAVRDIQTVAAGRDKLEMDHLDVLGYRNREAEIFPTIRKILHDGDPLEARQSIRELDEEPRNLITWIEENLPREYRYPKELSGGFDYLSKADIYLGRVIGSSYYRFWAYSNDLMTAGVCSAKTGHHRGFNRYAFPTWVRKMFSSKGRRSVINKLSYKIAINTHTTSLRAKNDILPYFSVMFSNDEEFRRTMVKEVKIRPEEAAYLLDTEARAKEVTELYRDEKEVEVVTVVEKKTEEKKEEKKKEEPEKQKTLFEF